MNMQTNTQTIVLKTLVTKKIVYLTMPLIFLLISSIFLYSFFMKNQALFAPVQKVFNAKAQPAYSHMIYGGFGEDALNKPMDVAVINEFVFVTDTNNKRVQVFDLGGTSLYKFGKEGTAKGEFKFPYGITGDSEGNVFVSDLYNGSISIVDAKGNFIRYFAEKDPSEKTIEYPGSIRIVDNKVYVTEIRQSKVVVFDMEGKKLKELGEPGEKPGQFKAPNAVTADKDGNIYVTDSGNQRVQLFDKDGKFVRVVAGSADGSVLVNPRGIGVDTRGIVYIVSNLTHLVFGYDQAVTTGKQLFSFGGNGEANNQFSLPHGLYVDKDDQVYITDTLNSRVAVYK